MNRPPIRATLLVSALALPSLAGCHGADGPRTPADARLAALAWLAASQEADGRWDAERHGAAHGGGVLDVGVTGLALLALVEGGSDDRDGPAAANVQRAAAWLLARQDPEGRFRVEGESFGLYNHALAGLALVRLARVSADPAVRKGAEKAIQFSLTAPGPEGGWRYEPKASSSDLSATAWFVFQLSLARRSGILPAAPALDGVRGFLDRVTDERGNGSYRAGEPPSLAMTAAGGLCRILAGGSKGEPRVAGARDLVLAAAPGWESRDFIYWAFGSEFLHLAAAPGEADGWLSAAAELLAEHQLREGPDAGTWDSGEVRFGPQGGRVFTAALGALTLGPRVARYPGPGGEPR